MPLLPEFNDATNKDMKAKYAINFGMAHNCVAEFAYARTNRRPGAHNGQLSILSKNEDQTVTAQLF